jgi:sulfur carrier protein
VNGSERDVPDGTTVAELLHDLGAPSAGIAVAVNERVVPGTQHGTTALADGDRIEIIRAVAGG